MPRPAAPIIQPEVVAQAVVHAAAHPIRQVYGSDTTKLFALVNHLMLEVVDNMLAQMVSAQSQRSGVEQSADFPNNVEGLFRDFLIQGDFDSESLPHLPYVARQMGQTRDLSDVQQTLDSLAQLAAFRNSLYEFAVIQNWIEILMEQQLTTSAETNQQLIL